MRLTEEDIKEINNSVEDDWNEGIFTEPSYIPVHIKEPVIYMRWDSEGWEGGDCWGNQPRYFQNEKPKFTVLDLALKKINPQISYLQYKEMDKLIHTNSESEHEYYGNSTEIKVEYIILSELYDFFGI